VADIQGIFFNFDGYPDGIHVVNGTGSTGFLYSYNVTGSDFSSAGDVIDLGNGVNMNGAKDEDGNPLTFEGGVKIGSPGIGHGDDISTTSFTLTTLPSPRGDISFDGYLGARLTSVYVVGNDRNGSSKLYGEGGLGGQGSPVPEPASAVMIGVGVALVRLTQMRKKFSEV
jgi:hypothetical protein